MNTKISNIKRAGNHTTSDRNISQLKPSCNNAFQPFTQSEIKQSIPDRFQKIAYMHADKIAIKHEDQAITYGNLNRLSNCIARNIYQKIDESTQVIAVMLALNIRAIASILAVLKTGRIYVVLDPRYPIAKKTFVLGDSKAGLLVTDQQNKKDAQDFYSKSLQILNTDELDYHGLDTELPNKVEPTKPACIVYTSGSTGNPKGVIDNHINVLHNMMTYTNTARICYEDHMTLLHPLSFGASRPDMFGALLNGASLHILDFERTGIVALGPWISKEEISIYHSTPTVFRCFTAMQNNKLDFSNVRLVHLGSEPVLKNDFNLFKRYFPKTCFFLNRFGTTETGTIRFYLTDQHKEINSASVPAGYAVEDIDVVLLNDKLKPVDKGEVGQIVVKSQYLSLGYWNQAQMTKQVCKPDLNEPDAKLYFTGDLGRFTQNDCLIVLGRKDDQVKINGYRIELAEVELALYEIGMFYEVVVNPVTPADGEPTLVAYFVPRDGLILNTSEIRCQLQKRLPEYMIPSAFIKMKHLPKTPNNKIDRKALPALNGHRPNLCVSYTAPQLDAEKIITSIWGEVLKVREVGVNDNFFDSGGNSLLMYKMHEKLESFFKIKLTITQLFQYPTVKSLAAFIMSKKRPKKLSMP